MKIIFKIFLLIITIFVYVFPAQANILNSEHTLTDSRIKYFQYSNATVYKLVLYTGFTTNIEFEDGEKIENIVSGEPSTWQINVYNGSNILISPTQENIHTNMIIFTNYRKYNFEILSVSPGSDIEPLFALNVRFIYPK